jgi:hypothetical protein
MYDQLLKLESYELSKKPTVSWERLMEIRHLKDRMIRKCQKLAKTTLPVTKKASRGDSFSFQTFTAPSDFRCKEMEKWFLQQQKRGASVPRRTITTNGYGAAQELMIAGDSHHPSSSSKQPMQRSITNPEPSKQKETMFYKPFPLIYPTRTEIPLPVPAGMRQIMSPPPLPVLLLSQREELGFDDPPQIAENAFEPRPKLLRRPSCIKRNSLGDIKSVSWADNGDIDAQFSQYVSAAREAQAAGKRFVLSLLARAVLFFGSYDPNTGKLEEVRKLYQDQVSGLEDLHAQVREGLDHLRLEATHLQRIEETIRQQREALGAGFQEFEQKQALFQFKGQSRFPPRSFCS